MSCVSAWCSSPELLTAMGSLSGNRTAVLSSVAVSSFVVTAFVTEALDYTAIPRKGKLPKWLGTRSPAMVTGVPSYAWVNPTNSQRKLPSKLRYLGVVEVANLHRRHYHVERLFAAGPHRLPHFFHVCQHVDQAFVEAI